MKRCAAIFALIALCSAAPHADVTVTTMSTFEGGMAAMMNGVAPRMIVRIKGRKMRTDMEFLGQTISSITDLTTRQMITLMPAQKTAQVLDAASLQAGTGTLPAMPKIDVTFEPTGRTQTIGGQRCDEFKVSTSVDMSQMGTLGPDIPKEAAAMFKDFKITTKGVVWVAKNAPGAAEYLAFQKAATAASLLSVPPSVAGAGPSQGSLSQAMGLFARAEGISYLMEAETSLEGNSPMIEMMKPMFAMKVINKVTDVSVAAIADEVFKVPADYTLTKP